MCMHIVNSNWTHIYKQSGSLVSYIQYVTLYPIQKYWKTILHWFIEGVVNSSLMRGVRGGVGRRWWGTDCLIAYVYCFTFFHHMVGLISGWRDAITISNQWANSVQIRHWIHLMPYPDNFEGWASAILTVDGTLSTEWLQYYYVMVIETLFS